MGYNYSDFELLNETIVSRDKLNALAQPQCSLKLAKEYELVRPFGYEIQVQYVLLKLKLLLYFDTYFNTRAEGIIGI